MVRALVRHGSPGEDRLRQQGCSTVYGDLKDPASLATACRGVGCVITTANALMSRRRGDSLKAVDGDGTLTLVAAAREAGVGSFIYTSVSPVLPADNPFVRLKRQGEAAVRASGMNWTILQPSAFMEIHAGPAAGWDFARGRARIMGSGRAALSYVSASDVAAFAESSVLNPAAADRALHITGPEPLSALDAVAIAERVTGKRFTVQRIPTGALAILSIAARPFSESLSSLFRMGVALDRGEVADMAPLRRDFQISQTSFESYVRQAVAPFLAQ
jgi:NADH dehydrogenase